MPNLKFKQLLLISNSTKAANQFEFDDHLTLITADDNSVGKSTLVKMLFWALGCDPFLDTTWENLDCSVLLRYSIGDSSFETMRYKNIISLNENGSVTTYPKITGEYSEKIANVFQFSALLPKRGQIALETPPPAYYFIPFYIDQKKSWGTAWDNFVGLGQYDGWKAPIIKYHIGLLPPKHFELELEKYLKKFTQKELANEVEKISTALEVVRNFIPKTTATIDSVKLNSMTDEIRKDLKELSDQQEQLFDELAKAEGDRSFLCNQKNISEKIIQELEKDYQFTVERVEQDEIECPLCGTVHDNSLVNRASILTDKQQAENQLSEINSSLGKASITLEKLNSRLQSTKTKISNIHDKYIIEEDNNNISLTDIIETIAGQSIHEKVLNTKGNKESEISKLETDIKDIGKSQKEILTDEKKKDILNAFITTFVSYVQTLGAQSVNISSINSPMDYNKVMKEGGAADGTRAILAYYLTIFSLAQKFGNEVIAPFVIDTPNQQEQSLTNYDKILDLITNRLEKGSQIILCALNNERLAPIKAKAKTIYLDDKKLLDPSKFELIQKEFEKYN
ncbi:hypothetical protein ACTJJ0_22170 [Chitinophaga sp. 22321]|uniref:hypothetical protein n=1 Tax=Chitinophaga sp. 22321 TaxID=3453909 RepID=UPI003F852E44